MLLKSNLKFCNPPLVYRATLFLIVFGLVVFSKFVVAQDDTVETVFVELWGKVRDAKTKLPLPYANIYLPTSGLGTVSNEEGYFQLDVPEKFSRDSIRFQFIGYAMRMISIADIKNKNVIDLHENIVDLTEMVIYGNAPDARSIVERVLANRERNYKKIASQKNIFARKRYTNRIMKINIDAKKSSVKEFQAAELELLKRNIPKISVSFTDFLAHVYTSSLQPDTTSVKIRPVRIVKLKEKKNDELEKLEKIFNRIVKNTGDDAYWKVRSGVLSQKIDFTEPDSTMRDSLKDGKARISYFKRYMHGWMKFASLDDEKHWDFLHNTGRYNYSVLGGTRMNDEEVYIVGFEPAWRGLYVGKLYISTSTFALIRADFGYAPSKNGTDFSLLGISYNQNQSDGSVSFEKMNDGYVLKYLSYRTGQKFGVSRNVSFIKKRDRFLFDKTEEEVKLAINVVSQSESSVEVMVLDESPISESFYNNVFERKFMDVQYVDHFDNSIWKGYSIIEPTETMKDFK